MKTFEDFDFPLPLSISEVLNKMATQTAPGASGSFYGTVQGNYFNLQYAPGNAKDRSDGPNVSGYVLAEPNGCRVFARVQVPESQMFNAGYGVRSLVFLSLLLLFICWDNRKNTVKKESIDWASAPQILYYLMAFVAMAYSGWRYMKTFDQKGKAETIKQFKQFLAA